MHWRETCDGFRMAWLQRERWAYVGVLDSEMVDFRAACAGIRFYRVRGNPRTVIRDTRSGPGMDWYRAVFFVF
jgi:hypothetical protein